MVNLIKDEREWEVVLVFRNDFCPHLYYPANYYGCRLLEKTNNDYCTLENCPHKKET